MTKYTKTNHYTYIIRHINGRYYVGRRSTKRDPLLDSYMGSGKWVKSIKDRSTLTKIIIAYYDTVEELKIGEMELIEKYFLDEYCMNMLYSSEGAVCGDKNHMYGKTGDKNHMYGKTGDKHPNYGKKHTEETKQKMSDRLSGDKHPSATITDHIAKMIKIRISEGATDRVIAEEYNTTISIVNKIRYGKSWKRVTI
jgi:NUMOD3 motif